MDIPCSRCEKAVPEGTPVFTDEPLDLWQRVRVLRSEMSVRIPATGSTVAAVP